MKKQQFLFYKEKVSAKIKSLKKVIAAQEDRLNAEVKAKGEQFSKGVEIIESRLAEHMRPVKEDMEILIKTRSRQQSDDLIAQNAILDRFSAIKREFDSVLKTVTFTLCPIVTCLFENQCIQMACEEQNELDRLKIALYGHKAGIQREAETRAQEKTLKVKSH